MSTKNGTPKQQWPACLVKADELAQTATLDPTEADTQNPLLIKRGIKLLNHLVALANQGERESVGVGYAQFACCVHGKVLSRPYLPSDTKYVLRLAHRITAVAGPKRVTKNGVTLEAGMDTFIWRSKPPHPMPSKAFESMPFTEEDCCLSRFSGSHAISAERC